jgi:SAM-dependent methyltransferase
VRALVLASLLLVSTACTATRAHGLRAGLTRDAALALRDDVPDYQKGFTAQFTVPRLRDAYDAYWYFTQSPGHDVHADFVAALERATREYDAVDVFLLAHTNRFIDWIAELPPHQRSRIRLVYDTGCGDAQLAQEWLALGVHSFVGHGDDNVAPVFYVSFLPAWLDGVGADEAVARANRAMEARLTNPLGRLALTLGRLISGERRDPDELVRVTRGTHFTRDSTH